MLFIFWLYLQYTLCFISYNDFIKGAFDRLIQHNALFIKMFQVLSANKFVSPEVADYFRRCTNNSTYSQDDIDIELIDEIKRDYNVTLYSDKPINTGMIAIVFKGNKDGTDVAVKISRKDIRKRLARGFKELQWFYKIICFFYKENPILTLVANFICAQDCILDQCSFQNEIHAHKTMASNLSEIENVTYIDKLIVPKIYNKDGESRFIISEFLEGSDCFSVDKSERDQYTRLMTVFSMSQIFLTEVVHTDTHPGNLIYMNHNGILKLGIIDFGMNCFISKETREGVVAILGSINNDYDPKKAYRFFEPFLLPKVSFASYSDDVRNKINILSEHITHLIKTGSVTEHQIVMAVKELGTIHTDFKKLSLNVETVQLVIAQACILSTCTLLSDKEHISKCYSEVIKELIS
jgi:predicted unusual protein kinase regulating ubiquinone biosynthesis (AarF/ABC1/UbiB family)